MRLTTRVYGIVTYDIKAWSKLIRLGIMIPVGVDSVVQLYRVVHYLMEGGVFLDCEY